MSLLFSGSTYPTRCVHLTGSAIRHDRELLHKLRAAFYPPGVIACQIERRLAVAWSTRDTFSRHMLVSFFAPSDRRPTSQPASRLINFSRGSRCAPIRFRRARARSRYEQLHRLVAEHRPCLTLPCLALPCFALPCLLRDDVVRSRF